MLPPEDQADLLAFMPRIRAKQTIRAWEHAAGPTAEAVGKVWLGLTGDSYLAAIAEAEFMAEKRRMKMEQWASEHGD